MDSDLTGAVDDDESSSGSNECLSVSCPSGSSCVPMELECFTTPCPQYKCVENVVEPDGEPASNHGDSQSSSSSNTASEPGSETTNEASAAGSAVTADGKYFAGVIVVFFFFVCHKTFFIKFLFIFFKMIRVGSSLSSWPSALLFWSSTSAPRVALNPF